MSWCFRVRVNLRETSKLECSDSEWIIQDGPERVWMAAADGLDPKPLADARIIVLRGRGYTDESSARAAGEVWQGRLMYAFSCLKVGADFGSRSPGGGFTEYGLAMVAQEQGERVLNDVHGVMTFECDPPPRFIRTGPVTAMVSYPHERLVEVMDAAIAAPGLDPAAREAYDLFSASFGVPSADARLALLMMAFEVLLEMSPRSEQVRTHVDRLVAETRQSGLPDAEVASLAGALEWLRFESIRQNGRRLARTLEPKLYQDLPPERFFLHCYDLRSALMHGAHPLPARASVDLAAANLELMMSDLLCQRGGLGQGDL